MSAAATASTSAGVRALTRVVLGTSASNPWPATAGFEAATVENVAAVITRARQTGSRDVLFAHYR